MSTRFIVLGHARSGSTVLTMALAHHPSVRMFGELFNDEEDERQRAFQSGFIRRPFDARAEGNGPDFGRMSGNVAFFRSGRDGSRFLDEAIFGKAKQQTGLAIGFKLFYNQAQSDKYEMRAWRSLENDLDLRVIHLTRRNLLASWISLCVAFQTNDWVRLKGTCEPLNDIAPFHCEPSQVQSYFEHIISGRQKAIDNFTGHPICNLEYETDISLDFDRTMWTVQDFLEIPRWRTLEPLTEKQGSHHFRERVSNYKELTNHFKGSQYENFFE